MKPLWCIFSLGAAYFIALHSWGSAFDWSEWGRMVYLSAAGVLIYHGVWIWDWKKALLKFAQWVNQ